MCVTGDFFWPVAWGVLEAVNARSRVAINSMPQVFRGALSRGEAGTRLSTPMAVELGHDPQGLVGG